jgi:hypothetical protein
LYQSAVDPNNRSSTPDLPRRAQAWRVSSFGLTDFIAASEHKEHRDSLRSMCFFVAESVGAGCGGAGAGLLM